MPDNTTKKERLNGWAAPTVPHQSTVPPKERFVSNNPAGATIMFPLHLSISSPQNAQPPTSKNIQRRIHLTIATAGSLGLVCLGPQIDSLPLLSGSQAPRASLIQGQLLGDGGE